MSEFLQRVAGEIQNRRLLVRGQTIVVAVSGGVDSMVLLHALLALAKLPRWTLLVAHFNHQLRGAASAGDEKFVRQTAAKYGLKFFSARADVKTLAAQSGASIEMAARQVRHEFLARVASQHSASVIATAHQADDQVEHFFLRIFRGTGGEALAGMKARSPSPADKTVSLIRPFLGFNKAELLAYAEAHAIAFRPDASNLCVDHLRNRVRHELRPLLEQQYQPALAKTVLRLMEIVGAEAEYVTAAARAWLAKSTPAFVALPVAVQRRVLHAQLVARGAGADFELIERLRRHPGTFVSRTLNSSVACVAGKLVWRTEVAEKFQAAELKLGRATRSAVFGGRTFSFDRKILRAGQGWRPGRLKTTAFDYQEMFDAAQVGEEILLRHWRAGDRFQPIGLKAAVKLQDLFVNAKMSPAQRRRLVLAVTAGGEIFWVEGLRIGEKFKLTAETRTKLLWNCSVLPV